MNFRPSISLLLCGALVFGSSAGQAVPESTGMAHRGPAAPTLLDAQAFAVRSSAARWIGSLPDWIKPRAHFELARALWNVLLGPEGWQPQLADGFEEYLQQEPDAENPAAQDRGIHFYKRFAGSLSGWKGPARQSRQVTPPDKSLELRTAIAAALEIPDSPDDPAYREIKLPPGLVLDRAWSRRFNLHSPIYRDIFVFIWNQDGPNKAFADLAAGVLTSHPIDPYGNVRLSKEDALKNEELSTLTKEIPRSLWGLKIFKSTQLSGRPVEFEWFYVPQQACWLPLNVFHPSKEGTSRPTLRKFLMKNGQILQPGFRLTRPLLKALYDKAGEFFIVSKITDSGVISFGSKGSGKGQAPDAYNFGRRKGQPYAAKVGRDGVIQSFEFAGLPEPHPMRQFVKKTRSGVERVLKSQDASSDLAAMYEQHGALWVTGIPIQTAQDGTGLFRVSSRMLVSKGRRAKPVVVQQVFRVPSQLAGKTVDVFIGRNGIALAYQVAGEAQAVWLRTMDVRARRRGKESVLDLAVSYGKELYGSRLDKVSGYARSLGGFIVLGRLPVDIRGEGLFVPLDRVHGIHLPEEIAMIVDGHPGLWAEVVMSRTRSDRPQPIAVRLGTYSSDDPLQGDGAIFKTLVELRVKPGSSPGGFDTHLPDLTPGRFRRLMSRFGEVFRKPWAKAGLGVALFLTPAVPAAAAGPGFHLPVFPTFPALIAAALIVFLARDLARLNRQPGTPAPGWHLLPARAAAHYLLLLMPSAGMHIFLKAVPAPLLSDRAVVGIAGWMAGAVALLGLRRMQSRMSAGRLPLGRLLRFDAWILLPVFAYMVLPNLVLLFAGPWFFAHREALRGAALALAVLLAVGFEPPLAAHPPIVSRRQIQILLIALPVLDWASKAAAFAFGVPAYHLRIPPQTLGYVLNDFWMRQLIWTLTMTLSWFRSIPLGLVFFVCGSLANISDIFVQHGALDPFETPLSWYNMADILMWTGLNYMILPGARRILWNFPGPLAMLKDVRRRIFWHWPGQAPEKRSWIVATVVGALIVLVAPYVAASFHPAIVATGDRLTVIDRQAVHPGSPKEELALLFGRLEVTHGQLEDWTQKLYVRFALDPDQAEGLAKQWADDHGLKYDYAGSFLGEFRSDLDISRKISAFCVDAGTRGSISEIIPYLSNTKDHVQDVMAEQLTKAFLLKRWQGHPEVLNQDLRRLSPAEIEVLKFAIPEMKNDWPPQDPQNRKLASAS